VLLLGHRQRLSLIVERRIRDIQLTLCAAELQICTSGFRCDHQYDRAPLRISTLLIRPRRFDQPSRAAEDVNDPIGVEPDLKEVVLEIAGDGQTDARFAPAESQRASADVDLRVQERLSDLARRPRLAEARLRDLNAVVRHDRALDERCEPLIIESPPPADVLLDGGGGGCRRSRRADGQLNVLRRQVGRRRLVVRTDHAASRGKRARGGGQHASSQPTAENERIDGHCVINYTSYIYDVNKKY
jgi:hypothetical protein